MAGTVGQSGTHGTSSNRSAGRPAGRAAAAAERKWQTYPADVLPLTVAEMDFALRRTGRGSRCARPSTVRHRVRHGRAGAGPGPRRIRDRRWDWELDPAAVTAVTDVGVGVVELLRVLTRPGDVVVISPPVYPPFFDWAPEAGARLLEVPLARGDDGWRLDLAALEAAFATHPAAYVLCNPHNPVGRVHTAEELAALVRLARLYGVTIDQRRDPRRRWCCPAPRSPRC